MKRCYRILALLLVVLSGSASWLCAQAPTPPPPPLPPGFPTGQGPPRDTAQKTGTARIRGHVVAAENGKPLRKTTVRAGSPELRDGRTATTDDSGVYELTDLPAGRYQITASKGGFIDLQYGQTRALEPGKPLEIRDGQTIDKVDFRLPRGARIKCERSI